MRGDRWSHTVPRGHGYVRDFRERSHSTSHRDLRSIPSPPSGVRVPFERSYRIRACGRTRRIGEASTSRRQKEEKWHMQGGGWEFWSKRPRLARTGRLEDGSGRRNGGGSDPGVPPWLGRRLVEVGKAPTGVGEQWGCVCRRGCRGVASSPGASVNTSTHKTPFHQSTSAAINRRQNSS